MHSRATSQSERIPPQKCDNLVPFHSNPDPGITIWIVWFWLVAELVTLILNLTFPQDYVGYSDLPLYLLLDYFELLVRLVKGVK